MVEIGAVDRILTVTITATIPRAVIHTCWKQQKNDFLTQNVEFNWICSRTVPKLTPGMAPFESPVIIKTPIRVNDDFSVTIFLLVELFISYHCITEFDLMRDDEAGLCLAGNYHVAQVPIIRLDVTLACSER